MIGLALVRSTTAVPEEQPLQTLTPLQLILEAKDVVLIREFQQVEQFGASLHDGERRALGVVDQDWDTAVGVETQEPFLLLLIGHNVNRVEGPFRPVDLGQLFQEDLDFLPVRRGLGNQMETL